MRSMRPTTKENCFCAFALFVIDALQFRLVCCVLVLCEVAGPYQSGGGY